MIRGAHEEKKGHNICDGFTANSEPIWLPRDLYTALHSQYITIWLVKVVCEFFPFKFLNSFLFWCLSRMEQRENKNEAAKKEKHSETQSNEGENIPYASIDFSKKGKGIKQNRNTQHCFNAFLEIVTRQGDLTAF